jgi:TonB family protein
MITIIIKSSLSLLLLYGLYWFLLKNEKLFVFNRYYLVFSLVFSLMVPFISIPINVPQSERIGNALITLDRNIQPFSFVQEKEARGNNSILITNSVKPPVLSISFILVLCYISGLILFILRFLKNIYELLKTIRESEKVQVKGYRIILTSDNPGPYSFFKSVFLNRDDYRNGRIESEILSHELEHIKQFHTIDIIIVEIVKIIYWFNPVYLLYDRAIRINHEYLADHNVIRVSYNIKNYAEKLFGFISNRNIPLTSGSSHSFTKKRLLMLTKSNSKLLVNSLRIFAALGMVVVVSLFLGFRMHERQSEELNPSHNSTGRLQNVVKGIVLKEDGKPLYLVTIIRPDGTGTQTGTDGRFVMGDLQMNDSLHFSCIGYKDQAVKADFNSEMVIKMKSDPDYKSTVMTSDATFIHEGQNVTIRMTNDKSMSLIVIDGKETNYKGEVKLKRDYIGSVKVLKGKEATDKYGDKGKFGVIEILSKKRTDELGVKPPEPKQERTYPDDYPTFQGKTHDAFTDWVLKNVKYPDEAKKKKIQGRITVNFNIAADGSVIDITCVGLPAPILKNAVIKTFQNSPKWEPAKNPNFNINMPIQISVRFVLPDKVLKDDTYNYVDEMPSFQGGEDALIKNINDNLRYPAEAKSKKIQGNVIVRFVITKEGTVEDPTVIKSIHPLLDAEALRVIGTLSKWTPGKLAGQTVSTYYFLPVAFTL